MAARVGGLAISRSRSARISPAIPTRDFRSLSRSSQRATTVGYVVLLPRFAAWSSHADRKMIRLVPLAKLKTTSDLVRWQAKVIGFRIGQADLIRSERSAHDIPHQRYMNADLHLGDEAIDLRIGCGARIGLNDPARESLLLGEFDCCQRRRERVIQLGKSHRLAKVGAAKNGEPVHAVSGDVNRCTDAVWQVGSLESRMAFLQAVINSASEILDFGECTSSTVRLTFLSISPAGQPWSTSTSNSAASLVDS